MNDELSDSSFSVHHWSNYGRTIQKPSNRLDQREEIFHRHYDRPAAGGSDLGADSRVQSGRRFYWRHNDDRAIQGAADTGKHSVGVERLGHRYNQGHAATSYQPAQ